MNSVFFIPEMVWRQIFRTMTGNYQAHALKSQEGYENVSNECSKGQGGGSKEQTEERNMNVQIH